MGPGRAWERGPSTRNAGLGSRGGGGGRSLPRLDSQGCRSPCACAAPGGKKGGGGGNFLPPGVYAQGLPGANVAVVGGPGSECDPPPQPRQFLGWARQHASLSKPPPLSGPGPEPGWGPGRGTGGLDPGGGHASGLWGGARLCAAGSQVGVSDPSRPQTRIWGPGLFTQSQVTFEVEERENHREETHTDLVVTRLPLTPCGCQRVLGGARKGERTGLVKRLGCVLGGEGLFMCGIVWTGRCVMWERGRAPRLPREVPGGRGLTSGSLWPGASRER